MKTLKIRNVVLGEGMPKIIVPIVDQTRSAIQSRLAELQTQTFQVVEWRADHFAQVFDPQAVLQVLDDLRSGLPEKVLLFTFRTKAEGGEKSISTEDYLDLNRRVAESGLVDLVDVEVFSERARRISTRFTRPASRWWAPTTTLTRRRIRRSWSGAFVPCRTWVRIFPRSPSWPNPLGMCSLCFPPPKRCILTTPIAPF